MSTQDIIGTFMLNHVVPGIGRESLAPDEDLLGQGIIDSLGIMKLIVFLEDTFKLKVDDAEIIPENFQNLNSMVSFVQLKAEA